MIFKRSINGGKKQLNQTNDIGHELGRFYMDRQTWTQVFCLCNPLIDKYVYRRKIDVNGPSTRKNNNALQTMILKSQRAEAFIHEIELGYA